MISLEAPSSNTMRYWRVSKDAIFVTRGEAERADKYYEEHIREIEDSQECWAVYRKDIEHVFLDGLIIEKGNVVSLQKEYLPNSRNVYWGFHPEKTSGSGGEEPRQLYCREESDHQKGYKRLFSFYLQHQVVLSILPPSYLKP